MVGNRRDFGELWQRIGYDGVTLDRLRLGCRAADPRSADYDVRLYGPRPADFVPDPFGLGWIKPDPVCLSSGSHLFYIPAAAAWLAVTWANS